MVYVVLLAMLAGFLALQLYRVLGKRTGHEQPLPKPAEERAPLPVARAVDTVPEPRDLAPRAIEGGAEQGLRAIVSADSSFDVSRFIDGARQAYRVILEAYWTGDVATLDEDGYLQITDRAKDVIKSGGEWISSIDLENAAVGHPGIQEAAVIGIPHPKWAERPLLLVVPKPGAELTKESVLEFLESRVVKWWLPDDVVFVTELPHTATGKLLKTKLRDQFKDYSLPVS